VYLDNVDYQIVGVLPRDFQFEAPVDLWVPLTTTDPDLNVRNSHFLRVIARVRPGITDKSVAADLDAVAKYESDNFPEMFPATAGFAFRARPVASCAEGTVARRLPQVHGAGAGLTCINDACVGPACRAPLAPEPEAALQPLRRPWPP